jgi:hypothetical protein
MDNSDSMLSAKKITSPQRSTMATLTLSSETVGTIQEANSHVKSIVGLTEVVSNPFFLNREARGAYLVVRSNGIKFENRDGKPTSVKKMPECWCMFTGSAFRQSTNEELNNVEWYQKVHLSKGALEAIENGQQLLALYVGTFETNSLEVFSEFRPGMAVPMVFKTEKPHKLLRTN